MTNGTGWKERYLDENGRMHEHDDGSQAKEETYFKHLRVQIKEVVDHFAQGNGGPMRGNHAKILAGIVGAEFRVSPDIPSDLAVGFLAKPGEVYKAHIRFSNAGSRSRQDDTYPDLRGAAVRVRTEQGEQDFLMTNAEKHHAKDAREAMGAIMSGIDKDIAEHLLGVGLIAADVAGLAAIARLAEYLEQPKHFGIPTSLGLPTAVRIGITLKEQMSCVVTSLATQTYWSAPIAIGNVPDPQQSVAVKYSLAPLIDDPTLPGNKDDLGQELKDRISGRAVKFLFQIQRYIEEGTTPIEDATKSWGKDNFETIAELTIPQGAEINDELVNSLVFNPWNVDSTAFQPLGSMNRARKVVYPASVAERSGPS